MNPQMNTDSRRSEDGNMMATKKHKRPKRKRGFFSFAFLAPFCGNPRRPLLLRFAEPRSSGISVHQRLSVVEIRHLTLSLSPVEAERE
jgi:hypothetical protein